MFGIEMNTCSVNLQLYFNFHGNVHKMFLETADFDLYFIKTHASL